MFGAACWPSDDPPHLVCVGRVGWKSEPFVAKLVETNYLDGRIIVMQEVSDSYLRQLYRRCLFTVFPSLYEGWACRSASRSPPVRFACAVIAPLSPKSPASSESISTSTIPSSPIASSAISLRMRRRG